MRTADRVNGWHNDVGEFRVVRDVEIRDSIQPVPPSYLKQEAKSHHNNEPYPYLKKKSLNMMF